LLFILRKNSREVVKLKMQTQGGNGRAKEDLEHLRHTLLQVEETMEHKSEKNLKVLNKTKIAVSTLEKFIEAFGKEEAIKSQKLFE